MDFFDDAAVSWGTKHYGASRGQNKNKEDGGD